MALTTYNELQPEPYTVELFNLLKTVEGAITTAYIDKVGIPTIGIGFNIKEAGNIREDVFSLFGLDWNVSNPVFSNLTATQRALEDSYIAQITQLLTDPYPANPTPAQSAALANALNLVMFERWNNLVSQLSPADQNKTRPQFSFIDNSDTGEMRLIFDAALSTYEKKVDDWLAGIPPSRERTVLVSLAFNSRNNS